MCLGEPWGGPAVALPGACARAVYLVLTRVVPAPPQVLEARLQHCLEHVRGAAPSCDICGDTGKCRMIPTVPALEEADVDAAAP